ncbi:DNA polymerase alpha/epsilon subunit B-domain-containing protein, partial [Cunninghamella echinulata]
LNYQKQFASLYFVRLIHLRPIIQQYAKERWETLPEKPQYISKTLEVQLDEICYIIGTVYMEMPLKPNVIQDLSEESSIVAPTMPDKYKVADSCKISLEDESGRVELTGSRLLKEYLVSGMVVGILGKETTSGAFEVLDICYPGIPPQSAFSIKDQPSENDKYVAILSGLNVGTENSDIDLKIQLLTEYLTGELGNTKDQINISKITRVILAGNSLAPPSINKSNAKTVSRKKKKRYGYDLKQYDGKPLEELDQILNELCMTTDVDIMPGRNDPVGIHLPQQPLRKFLFDQSKKYSSLHTTTNPYWCKIDDVTFLGTSGQNIDDIYKYIDGVDRLKMTEDTLFWRHMAPSAPDTLWCHPFQDHDPFLIKQCPQVYFIGNQPQFETSIVHGADGQKARIILVPSFAETGIIVLLNLSTLECSTVQIDPIDSSSSLFTKMNNPNEEEKEDVSMNDS